MTDTANVNRCKNRNKNDTCNRKIKKFFLNILKYNALTFTY